MLDKIEIGKEYLDIDGDKVKVTAIGDQNVLYTFFRTEHTETIEVVKEWWSELPKPKVKRAKYLYKFKTRERPEETSTYYIDNKDFIDNQFFKKDVYEFIRRLQETEREFDE